jgi:GlpG protein
MVGRTPEAEGLPTAISTGFQNDKGRPLRQIGTLPKNLNPKAFADYLLALGMKTRVDDRPEGWDVWIYNEDHFQQARDELQAYLRQPDDPRYRGAAETAESIRRKEKELEKKFRKNFRDSSDVWGYPSFRQRPLNTILLVACVIIFIMQNIPTGTWPNVPTGRRLVDRLLFTTFVPDAHGQLHSQGLAPIERGEVWRLFTPALMHVNLVHIFFNLWWLHDLGTLIEVRRGTLRLAVLILVSAAISNYGQSLWYERMDEVKAAMGMSGVIYALFGYVWMKGMYQPEQRMGVPPNTVNLMLIWLVVCMTGYIGPIGNAAHFIGLAVGVVAGIMGF